MLKFMFAVAAITLMSGAAIAGEGQGNPFPFQAPTSRRVVTTDPVVRPLGSAGEVQSIASLPVGALDGTAQGANLRAITPSPTQIAQPQIPTARVPG